MVIKYKLIIGKVFAVFDLLFGLVPTYLIIADRICCVKIRVYIHILYVSRKLRPVVIIYSRYECNYPTNRKLVLGENLIMLEIPRVSIIH